MHDRGGARGQLLGARGKGQRLREVPLVETVARELRAYLAARALPEDLQGTDGELPLIERLREDPFEAPRSGAPKTTLATSSVYRSLKRFFAACATALEAEGYPHAAVRLRSASTHWLRHTHGTLALKAEIPLTTVRDSLGHANLSTSGIYLHEDLVERKRQMERLFRRRELGGIRGRGNGRLPNADLAAKSILAVYRCLVLALIFCLWLLDEYIHPQTGNQR